MKFRNFLYENRKSNLSKEAVDPLWPRCEVRDLLLWKDVYAVSDVSGSGNNGGSAVNTQSNRYEKLLVHNFTTRWRSLKQLTFVNKQLKSADFCKQTAEKCKQTADTNRLTTSQLKLVDFKPSCSTFYPLHRKECNALL